MNDASNIVDLHDYRMSASAQRRTGLDVGEVDDLITSFRIHEMVAAYRGDQSASRTWRTAADLLLESME